MSDLNHNFLIFNWKDIGACIQKEMCGVKTISTMANDDGLRNYVGRKKSFGTTFSVLLAVLATCGFLVWRWRAMSAKQLSDEETIYASDPDLSPA